MCKQDIFSVDVVPLFGPDQRLMIQIFNSNLVIVDLVKSPFE